MAQTQRSLAELFALLADNSTGAIDPADLRDVVETLRNGVGEISITAASPVVVTVQNTWQENSEATWAASANLLNWAMTVNGRLYYTGPSERMCHIAATLEVDLTSGGPGVAQMAIAKNGTVITTSITQQTIDTGVTHEATAIHAYTMAETGDYLSIMVRNTSATADIGIDFAQLFVMDMAV
jgi:hypothetical protein